MKVKYSFVCEAANLAQSGNLNVLGIFKNITSSLFPFSYPKFVYVAHIEFHRTEICKHKFKVVFIDDDGKDIINPLIGEIDVNPNTPWTNIIFEFNSITFQKPGTCQIDLTVDNQHICTENIEIFAVGNNQ